MTDPTSAEYRPWLFETGIDSPFTWVFEGAGGLERLTDGASWTVEDPASFSARLVRVQLDHVALEVLAATPHRYSRVRDPAADPGVALFVFVLVTEGSLTLTTPFATFGVGVGECVLLDTQVPVAYSASGPVRMLRTLVGSQHVPIGLRHRTIELVAPLERTPLIDAFIAFIANVLRSAMSGRAVAGIHTTRAVADLHTALLAEAQDAAPRRHDERGLRPRIERYIDEHLSDPDLGPRTIAEALDVSVRHVHGTFNMDGNTVARAIRDRRVDALAAELRTTQAMPSTEYLVARSGFRTASAMEQAFRKRIGRSMTSYHRSGRTR